VNRHGPIDRSVDRGKGTVDRSGGPTDMSQLSVGHGRPRTWVGRPADRPTDVFFSPFWIRTPFLFWSQIQSGFPKFLRLSDYKYGLEPVSLYYSFVLIVESKNLSLPCPEDVGKLSNLVKYCVGLLSLLFLYSCRVGISPAASVSNWWIPRRLLARAQQVVSEHSRFVVGSCVDFKGISCC